MSQLRGEERDFTTGRNVPAQTVDDNDLTSCDESNMESANITYDKMRAAMPKGWTGFNDKGGLISVSKMLLSAGIRHTTYDNPLSAKSA